MSSIGTKKYYFAYDERYKRIHEEGLLWFSNKPTQELLEWIRYNHVPTKGALCEIGCGEGRDALFLASQGYRITAVDASHAAIEKCRQLSEKRGLEVNWIAGDALELCRRLDERFDWIYSVGTLHMLVEDEDRRRFLQSMHDLLKPGGKALIVSMGDGQHEEKSDISTAFELQERTHMETGRTFKVAGTSFRAVNWETHERELMQAGFEVEQKRITQNDEYYKCMTVYLKRS